MNYDHTSPKEKWTIMMYMRDFNLMLTYAYALRASNELTVENIDEILQKMEDEGVYRPRNGGSTFTGKFKSIQIAWYMFGYYKKNRKKNEEKKMVFSPLGNLLLDNLDDKDKICRIFLTMLYGNGFRQPFSKMDNRFNIFAYRLIFKLLRDERLCGKLYSDEVFYYVMFCKEINETTYEQLVSDIIEFRKRDPYDKYAEFKENENVVGLACHEWRYTIGMLESAGIVSVCNDNNNRTIGKLTYGKINLKTGQPNAIRSYKEDYIVLKNDLCEYVDTLLSVYPFTDKPYPEDELSTKFNSSLVVEMYSFYPPELLREIGMDTDEDKAISEMLSIANDVNYYSRTETDTGKKFEEALTDAFNMFKDVDAERIAGAGNTDIECIYYMPNNINKKFDIEAKATTRKLLQVNSVRLKMHRDSVSSKYTIIVTPNFAIGVLGDIKNENSVIVKSATLANYFYQNILKYGRNISYHILDDIIVNNIGKDITDCINNYVYRNFGHAANDIKISAS